MDYTPIASEFSATRQHAWKEFELLLPYLKNRQHILDLGCGNGRLFKFLQKHKKINYLGVDNNEDLLKIAKKENPEAKFQKGDLAKIPVKSGEIDILASIASFHHLPTKELRKKSLGEMRRVLKTNGILFLTVWNLFQPKYKKYIWKSRLRSLLSFGKKDSRGTLIPWSNSGIKRYYHAFTPREIEKLLNNSGFEIIYKEKGNNLVYLCQKI